MSKQTVARHDTAAEDVGLKVGNAVIHAVNSRATWDAGRTFGDFVRACYALGVRDTDPLDSIEYGVSKLGRGVIQAERVAGGAVEIGELS